MLIALRIQTLVAFFGLAAILCQTARPEEHYFNETFGYGHEVERSPHGNRHRHQPPLNNLSLFHGRYYPYYHELKLKYHPKRDTVLLFKQNKQLLEHEYEMMNKSGPGVDCCPSVLEMIEPKGGKNDQGSYVELYQSKSYSQRFYELSCHEDVLNQPCRFMDKKLHTLSKCVQMYSYTYALVKDTAEKNKSLNVPTLSGVDRSGNDTYTLDYISIRSGCSCVVMPPNKEENTHKARRKKKHKAHKTGINEVKSHHKNNNKKKWGTVLRDNDNNKQMPVLRGQAVVDDDYR